MATTVLSLPEELVDSVCQSLGKRDVVNLRATCRELKEKTYHQFAVKHFRETKIMFTVDSLQSLIDFATSATFGANKKLFGSCIRHLCISAASFPSQTLDKVNGLPLDKEKDDVYRFWKDADAEKDMQRVKKQRRKAHARLMHEQRTLRKQSKDVQLLATALSGLAAVDTISIVPAQIPDAHIEYDSIYNKLPWGMERVRQAIGFYPESDIKTRSYWSSEAGNLEKAYHENAAWIVCATLSAIERSGIKKLKTLEILVPFSLDRNIPKNPAVTNKTLIPSRTISDAHFESLRHSFSTLKTLTISVEEHYSRGQPRAKSLKWVHRFTDICPNVEKFSFYANNNEATSVYSDIVKGLAFPHLRSLALLRGPITYEELGQLLTTYSSTLEHISLEKVTLRTKDWVQVLQMLKALPHLKLLELGKVMYVTQREGITYYWNTERPLAARNSYSLWYDPGAQPGQKDRLQITHEAGPEMVTRLDKQIWLQTPPEIAIETGW
ncbi:uncharacterized protein BDZ99DRAFT_298626 [Mytilinidion resinicola]|uniref:F-box domain-containing protein n=1 Tax=Mytilinidion resinicola TaxID=574789 RepID=A0A6A6YQU1_9PEZI|nr:uncharacterized protein BDZ99DRAFT_298626 [Mytilinidion resinicola]KAF2811272.1 hypothetical protein BDZ99DRAFT_298626 [Mytilinidion resinicola]